MMCKKSGWSEQLEIHDSRPTTSKWQLTMMMITVVPREIEDNGYAKFRGVKKIHYGLCENDELTVWVP